MRPTPERIMTAFGKRPFTLEQAARAGGTRDAIRNERAVGRLRRCGRGVYSAQTEPGSLDQVAAAALDIAARSTLAQGIALVDSYGRLGNPTRRTALDPAFRASIRDELLATTVRMRTQRGAGRARYAAALADTAAESAPESYARGLFIADGQQVPLVGHSIQGADGRTYYVDPLWPATRQLVEIDGAGKYQDRSVLVAEKRREDAIRAAGYRVPRILAHALWRTGIIERRAA